MLWNSLQSLSGFLLQKRLFLRRPLTPAFVPQLAGVQQNWPEMQAESDNSWIWFAVPKRKHTRSRKRMKTTAQKRLVLKKNIVFDPRTGEVTLKHKMPFNWKDYLPKED